MELLLAEYAKVKAENRAMVEHAQDISMSIDNWTTLTQQSVCACNLKLPDGETLLWDVHDFSHDRHSGVNIKGEPCMQPGACSALHYAQDAGHGQA